MNNPQKLCIENIREGDIKIDFIQLLPALIFDYWI